MLLLKDCFKRHRLDLDKACPPEETVTRVKKIFEAYGTDILAETKRIDTGRLGIPVFMSLCGPLAKKVMPTRKQMGKGASAGQAEASALMELAERYSFFSFWADENRFVHATWNEMTDQTSEPMIPLATILQSVEETLPLDHAARVMSLVPWRFHKALNVTQGREEWVPLDWFKKLNEFNGSSAGNTPEESILQGACELVERHVCNLISQDLPQLPTIDPKSFRDEALIKLWNAFQDNGIVVYLKDFSLGLPVPTVGALAFDPIRFPGLSEIVFTAGTAATPEKAAIRALTEIAQLAGDFESGSNYEASGLAKFTSVQEIEWIKPGEVIALDQLPNIENENILHEIHALCRGLQKTNQTLYAVDTTHPNLGIATNYSFVPGFGFRERTPYASLGLFVGRILAEEMPIPEAEYGLDVIAQLYPDAHFIPFFRGILYQRAGDSVKAREYLNLSLPLQPCLEDQALATFYLAHTYTTEGQWALALPLLDQAIALDDKVQEFFNLRGVARFKLNDFEAASKDFQEALNLNNGSALDLANLGLCYKFLDKKNLARDFLSSALRIDPTLEFARNHLQSL